MKKVLAVILAAAVLPAFAPAARAQNLDDTFRKVSPFVVVVRSKGRDVGASGVTRFNETGSGVLISSDGRVMTAAHVVNGMDEITVEGIASQNISKSGGSEGLGFVVTSKSARTLLVPRKVFWGALQGMLLTGRLATIFNVPAPAAFLVKTVAQDSMAWNMGLQGSDGVVTVGGREIPVGGDIILSVEGIPVVSEENIEKIRNMLVGKAPGATFKMNVLRAGKVIELTGTSQ